MYFYQAFQLTIQSELAFIELASLPNTAVTQPDIKISYGYVDPEGLEAPLKKSIFFQVSPGCFWLNVANIARFLVINGNQIIIDPAPGIDEDSIRIFLLGSCFGALLMQRGLFLLHGNAIKIGSTAISVTGMSGAGKSTLAGVLFKRGYSILADDVCAINEQGEVIPSFPQIKLWADVAKKLAFDTVGLRKVRPNLEKYAVPLGENFCPKPLPLKVVYILNSHNKQEIAIKHFSGMEKFKLFRFQCYRPSYVEGLVKKNAHHMQCAKLVGQIALSRVTRADSGYQLDTLADYIESDLTSRGLVRE